MNAISQFVVSAGGSLHGEITVPGDKSMSHRSIMLASIAEGTSHIKGFLQGEDSLNTLRAFRAMGINISEPSSGEVTIEGNGLHGLKAPDKALYLGNSGTCMRLLAGLLAAQPFLSTLEGDESLSKRPMRRVTTPLSTMGADIKTQEGGLPPLEINGQSTLQGIAYDMPVASAQVKSCLLLAGLYAQGTTSVSEPAPTRDHTERMLESFSYPVRREGNTVSIQSGGRLRATDLTIPADISSAAFFMVGASIAKDSDITLLNVGINPTRTGIIDILKLMGADITLSNERMSGAEPIADIRVRSAELKGIDIPESLVPLAIDEFPVLFVAAACAKGQTRLTGAEELRVKETDRIQVMADGLLALGVQARPTKDGMIVEGCMDQQAFNGGHVNSCGDHRIAMAFTMAALRARDTITIDECENVATSFPGFHTLAQTAGSTLEARV